MPSARDNLVALIGKVFAASTCIGLFICYFWLWQKREYTWIIVLTVIFGPSTIYTLNRFVSDWWIAGPKRSLIHYTSLFMTAFAITLMVGAVLTFVVGIALIGLVFSRRRG